MWCNLKIKKINTMSPTKQKNRIAIILIGVLAAVCGYDTAIAISRQPDVAISTIAPMLFTPECIHVSDLNREARGIFTPIAEDAFLVYPGESLVLLINWAHSVLSTPTISDKEFNWNEVVPGNWVKLKPYTAKYNETHPGVGKAMLSYFNNYVQIRIVRDKEFTIGHNVSGYVWKNSWIDTSYPVISGKL